MSCAQTPNPSSASRFAASVGVDALEVEEERGHPAVHRLQPVHGRAVRQPVEEALPELPLVGGDRLHPADRLEVRDRRREAGEELVRRRPGLEAAADRIGRRRTRLVRAPRLEQLVPSVRETEVRPAELVRRADEHVTVERQYVHRDVGRVLDGVDPAQRSDRVRELRDARHVDDRADRVRRADARDHAHAVVQPVREVVVVEPQVLGHVHPLDLEAAVRGELDPRCNAAVVVEAGDQDPVALVPVARGGAREREVEHGHVLTEDHVVGRAAEEAGAVLARRREDLLDPLARLVVRADVRARLAQRAGDRVAYLVRHLRAARRVEEDEPAVTQRGEASADRIDVQ